MRFRRHPSSHLVSRIFKPPISQHFHAIADKLLEDAVTPLVEAFWKERGLHLSPEQRGLTPMAEGLDVRGQHRRKDTGKRLIKPSAKRIKTVWRNVRGVMKAHKSAAAGVSSAK
jgi:hypothetical protein